MNGLLGILLAILSLGLLGGGRSGGSDSSAADEPVGNSDGSNIPDLPDAAYDIGWAGLSDEEQQIVELVG